MASAIADWIAGAFFCIAIALPRLMPTFIAALQIFSLSR